VIVLVRRSVGVMVTFRLPCRSGMAVVSSERPTDPESRTDTSFCDVSRGKEIDSPSMPTRPYVVGSVFGYCMVRSTGHSTELDLTRQQKSQPLRGAIRLSLLCHGGSVYLTTLHEYTSSTLCHSTSARIDNSDRRPPKGVRGPAWLQMRASILRLLDTNDLPGLGSNQL